MSPISKAKIKNIDHLGIVAGLIDEIGIVETINSKLGIDPREVTVQGLVMVEYAMHFNSRTSFEKKLFLKNYLIPKEIDGY